MLLAARIAIIAVAAVALTVAAGWALLLRSSLGPAERIETRSGSWPRRSPVFDVWLQRAAGTWLVASRRYCDGERPQPSFYFELIGNEPIEDWLPRWAHPRAVAPPERTPCQQRVEVLACGWPLPALRCTRTWTAGAQTRGPVVHGGVVVPAEIVRTSRSVVLPARPLWTGLTIDAALAAGAIALATGGTAHLRRTVRRMRRRCPRCGFRLYGGAGGCPECGWNHRGALDEPRAPAGAAPA